MVAACSVAFIDFNWTIEGDLSYAVDVLYLLTSHSQDVMNIDYSVQIIFLKIGIKL